MSLESEIAAIVEDRMASGKEVGMQVAVYHRGQKVADLAFGTVSEGGDKVSGDTIFPIFSVVKAALAVGAHVQAAKHRLDIDAPIASYWPEFAAQGKETITLRHVLSHQAGIPQMPAGVTLERAMNWEWMTAAIADLAPMHAPGAESWYHGMTYGWLVGEAIRRTDPAGRRIDAFVQEEVMAPLGIDSFFIAVPAGELGRVAELSGAPYPPDLPEGIPIRVGIPVAVDLQPANFNRHDVRQAEIPAVGGYATAAAVARLFAMLAGDGEIDGVRLLPAELVASMRTAREDSEAPDPFLGGPARLSVGGFMLGGAKPAVGTREDTMFSIGAGGSIAWADHANDLAVAITHNRMYGHQPAEDDPQILIGNAIRKSLGAKGG
jgi:CubicO group peptidase (beta-lactamase class C family)